LLVALSGGSNSVAEIQDTEPPANVRSGADA